MRVTVRKYLVWATVGIGLMGIVFVALTVSSHNESGLNGALYDSTNSLLRATPSVLYAESGSGLDWTQSDLVNTDIQNTDLRESGSVGNNGMSTGKSGSNTPVNTMAGGQAGMYQEDIDNVVKTAVGFKTLGDTVDYRTIDKGYRSSFLYYFSSGVNAEESVDSWIKEVKDNNIVSEARFIADKSSVYVDSDYFTRIRGTFYVKYGSETNAEYLNKKGLTADKWYGREEELLLYIAIDDYKWPRGEWVYYRGYILTEFKEAKL